MLKQRKKPNTEYDYFEAVADIGNIDYVKNGEVIKDAPVKVVMVANTTERDALKGYEAGTIAFTAGFGSMWQLNASGTWVEIS